MANRRDTGSSPADQKERPNAQRDDSIPEMTDDVRGRREDEEDDEFEDTEDLDETEDEDEDQIR